MPATTAWGYGRSLVPSSNCLITTTFLPAWRPCRTIATCSNRKLRLAGICGIGTFHLAGLVYWEWGGQIGSTLLWMNEPLTILTVSWGWLTFVLDATNEIPQHSEIAAVAYQFMEIRFNFQIGPLISISDSEFCFCRLCYHFRSQASLIWTGPQWMSPHKSLYFEILCRSCSPGFPMHMDTHKMYQCLPQNKRRNHKPEQYWLLELAASLARFSWLLNGKSMKA